MSVALRLYEQLTQATDDRERFRLIADAIGAIEDRWPQDIVRTGNLRETELRLQAEMRETELRLQKEIEQVRLQLQKEIEQVRRETQQVRHETQQVRRETEHVRLEVERVRTEMSVVEVRLHKALHRQTVWIIGAVGAVVGLIRLLDYLLA